jgi:hypothetical protein
MNFTRNMPIPSRARRTSHRIAMPSAFPVDLDYLDELQEQETIRAARAGIRRSRMMKDDRYL